MRTEIRRPAPDNVNNVNNIYLSRAWQKLVLGRLN